MQLVKRIISSILSALLVIMLVSSMILVTKGEVLAEEIKLSNPRIVPDSNMNAGQKVTWDCVWFGSYPQAEVVPASKKYTELSEKFIQSGDLIKDDVLYQKLQSSMGWNEQGDIIIGGEKYRRITREDVTEDSTYSGFSEYHYIWKNEIYHYFKYQPIKWRVLSVENGSEVLLLADRALDDKKYHTAHEGNVTWEGCTMRSWLNGYGADSNMQSKDYSNNNFIDTAFDASFQAVIKETIVENKNNLAHDNDGGNNTIDKVFLLSLSEVYTEAAKKYGFVSDDYIHDEARRAKSSIYAKAMGTYTYIGDLNDCVGNCYWWLRTQGEHELGDPDFSYCATDVDYDGYVSSYSKYLHFEGSGSVRPALNLNVTSSLDSTIYSYAGTVCSDGTVEEVAAPSSTSSSASGSDVTDDNKNNSKKALKKGFRVSDKKTKAVYKVVEAGKNRTVEYVKSTKKDPASISVPASIKLQGKIYKVVSVGKDALKNNKKLKTVKLGKNIKKIGKQAFYQCKNLRNIIVKTKKLTIKSVGSNAFGKGAAKIKVTVEKGRQKKYARIFIAKGMSKKALFIN